MKAVTLLVVWVLAAIFTAFPASAVNIMKLDFEKDTFGAEPKTFSSITGKWVIDKDGQNLVYAVDGRKLESGLVASGVADKAKGLYGERYAEFLDNLEAYKYFPLTIYKDVESFTRGTITVSFKGISGRIDQAAGIVFNIKQNGDYLTIRANCLENNLVLWKMVKGKRSSEVWVRKVPSPSNTWHTLKVVIDGNKVEGYLNGQKYIDYTHKEPISGKIGLWSKADSYVFFDNFTVQPL